MRLPQTRNGRRSLFFSTSHVHKVIERANSFQDRCNQLIEKLSTGKRKPEKKVVDIAFRSAHNRISKQRLEWTRFLRFMGKDSDGFARLRDMGRSDFLLELFTFVESRLSEIKQAKDGRRNSSKV